LRRRPVIVRPSFITIRIGRLMGIIADAGVGDAYEEPSGEYKQNLSKDARGAVWRAQLAVRQVDEFMETG